MKNSPRIVAVIDLGSTAFRIVIAEIQSDGFIRTIDRAMKPISLGRDVFSSGFIGKESTTQAMKILSGFCEMLKGWKIAPSDVRVIATSALRESRNRDMFVDRVFIRTGLRVRVVEGVEENHLTYLAVQGAIDKIRPQFVRSNTLIIEVGGGTTEIMMFSRGKMVAAHSLRLGTVRIMQRVSTGIRTGRQINNYVRESIRSTKEVLDSELKIEGIRNFVAVGGEARVSASKIGRKEHEKYSVIEKTDFDNFVDELQVCTAEECMKLLEITYSEAENLIPALLIYKYFMEATKAERLIVPDVSIREGVLISFAAELGDQVGHQFHKQVVASAASLGKKFHYDEKHSRHVTDLALSLFDQLMEHHGLDIRARLFLEVAGLLHDIGYYIRTSGHHKHGMYIINNSEIFGFSRSDIQIISNVVRYHRKSMPISAHTAFYSLRREDRLMVLKLAAILRVADGLDRGHYQRIKSIKLDIREDEILMHLDYTGDISAEHFGLRAKGQMFEDVFGYSLRIA